MSDGALSQAEIDALLGGGSSSEPDIGGGGTVGSGSSADAAVIGSFLGTTSDTLSSNLGMMTGGTVKFSPPLSAGMDRDGFLAELPPVITCVKIDYIAGFPGEHQFIFGEDTAKAIVALMNKEENVTLDEMAMSVIGEMVSTISGAQITALTAKTGNKGISSASPEAANVPKAAAPIPAGDFVRAVYNLDLGDGQTHKVWEVFGPQSAGAIANAINAANNPQPSQPQQQSNANMYGGTQNNSYGAASPVMGMNNFGQTPNVQNVQFPGLNIPQLGAREQGNIGLLMDVNMEMTVELGRTHKSIKDILGMGEGTIIELDKLAGEPVDILVNNKLIAKGEVVVIDENFGVRVTEIISPAERVAGMS